MKTPTCCTLFTLFFLHRDQDSVHPDSALAPLRSRMEMLRRSVR